MNEKMIYLLEKNLDQSASEEEIREFESLLISEPELRSEYEEQKRVKGVLKEMKLKNPSVEVWDSYWLGVYNRVERGIAWIAISIGVFIILTYIAITAVEQFFADSTTPLIVKIGIAATVLGFMLLLFSVFREKLFTYQHDKYKEIQR